MIRFLARRFAWAFAILWAVSSITFVATLKLSDPVTVIAGAHASARDREHVRRFYGLDQPALTQYTRYLSHIAHGDLGLSYHYRVPVTRLITERLPRTLLLGVMAMLFEVTVGVTLGVLAASRRATRTDTAIMASSFVMMSTPTFLSGKFILIVAAYYLGWFPIGGFGIDFWDHIYHAILPALTLGLLSTAFYARLARNELVEILQSDFVRTARAKGLSEPVVVVKHALRNALLPVVTSLGLSVGSLFAGAVVTETIYAWHGVGRLAYDAISGNDVPVIVGTVIFGSFGIQMGNLLSDLAYAVLDPRIRRA